MSERHEGIGHEASLRRADAIVGLRMVGELAKIFKGARLVFDDAVAVRVHAAKLPDRPGHAEPGRALKLRDALIDFTLAQRLRTRAK